MILFDIQWMKSHQQVHLSQEKQKQFHIFNVFVSFGGLTIRQLAVRDWIYLCADNRPLRPLLLDKRSPFITSLLKTLQSGFSLPILGFRVWPHSARRLAVVAPSHGETNNDIFDTALCVNINFIFLRHWRSILSCVVGLLGFAFLPWSAGWGAGPTGAVGVSADSTSLFWFLQCQNGIIRLV